MLKHFQILTFILVVTSIMACTRKTQVVSGNYVDREKPTLNYYLSKNGIELNLTLNHTYVFKGPFHDYSYLLKLNDPDFRSTAIENLKIEQVTMKRYSVPDTKNEFSYSWKGNSLPFVHFNDTSIVKEHKMAFNDQLVLFDYKEDEPEYKPVDNVYNRFDFERTANSVMDQNENLIEKLYEAANGFSSEEKATYYAKQVDSLKDAINKFDFRIKNAIKLYNTFEGEDMASKAVQFADIIHKLIQLKTSLAAGESDINYENLNTGPMLESIDQMIQSYSKPFKTEIKEQTIVLSYSFIPESPDKEIYLGLLRSEEGNFTLSDKLKDAVPLGIFEIHSKCQPLEVSENQNKGMVYKIMSPCTYNLFYRRSTNSEEMNHIYQYTTGIAQFGKETQTPSQAREISISSFDGSLLKFR